MRAVIALALVACVGACGAPSSRDRVVSLEPPPPSARIPTPEPARSSAPRTGFGSPVPGHDGLRAAVHGASRVRYQPMALGVAGETLALRLKNEGAIEVELDGLALSFEALRDGVRFPCTEHAGAADVHPREPKSLAPGAAFVFEREIDCVMPLAGAYEVRISLATRGNAPVVAGSLAITLDDPDERAARPLATTGLYATVSGDATAATVEASAAHYHVVVALVNASGAPISLPDARASLDVDRGGKRMCNGKLAGGMFKVSTLAPGEVARGEVALPCALKDEDVYDLTANVSIGGATAVVGRFKVRVTSDPALLVHPPS